MNAPRKVCVVSGSRADYGLLFWLLKEIEEEPALVRQLIATGMHLSPEFGLTYREIEADGFEIDEKVEMLLSSDTAVGIAKSIGVGVMGFADALDRLKPDILVLVGDRFEILAAAQAAMAAKIPIAHIHGGESSEGSIDEAIRHAVTKMSHLHFTAAESYRTRVIQLGEDPARVFNFGAVGIDNLASMDLLRTSALEAALDFKLSPGPLVLCTYHPVTLSSSDPGEPLLELFKALGRLPNARIVITKANADAGGRVINEMIDDYVAANPERVRAFVNLGQLRYLSVLSQADVVVGNSSSGIIEAPAARTATVNIGDRQRGRLKASSVIDCEETEGAIFSAVTRALSPEFQELAATSTSLYGTGGTAKRIAEVLRNVSLDGIVRKSFYDLECAATAKATA